MHILNPPRAEVVPSSARPRTHVSWLESRHSFSFGPHYNPENTHHGVLLVNNEELVTAGSGFDTHPHQNMEILTWVLEGSLLHQDSMGHAGVLYPGLAQRMSSGTGITHSERNDSWRLAGPRHDNPVHFIQMWVLPDETGDPPDYDQTEIDTDLAGGSLVPVASGMPKYRHGSALRIRNRNAALHISRLQPGYPVVVPDAPYVHVHVARGSANMESIGDLGPGDSVRLTGTGGHRISTTSDAEVLIWEMHTSLTGR
ncbi:pirin family protein [Hoyosella subflava]|uniref:YhhW family protein n=1 Tax=Hoyosella subflava (strain DSM 45089 / JCM 17490 / NBRC 109087 / DQS3-9A1) TaxID=443218 RepID=F6EK42_HOYSD|nr:pirin-like bicupin family protein [Hoyosella subflava]AEF42583.1 YhhW family protein [Hoyosella subflava DQS3-9A1]